MSILKLARPPKDLGSFIGRKWLESINTQSQELNNVLDLPFVLLLADPSLPNSRTIAVAANLTLTDTGAGGTLTINLSDTAVTPGTYNSITIDQKGRVTSGASSPYASTNVANVFTLDQSVPDEAYSAGWNGSLEVPTKNALYDKIEAISSGASDGDARRLIHLGY